MTQMGLQLWCLEYNSCYRFIDLGISQLWHANITYV